MAADGKREKEKTLQESRRERQKGKIYGLLGSLSLSSLKGEINQCSEKGAVLCE